jgi:hypothetical protein
MIEQVWRKRVPVLCGVGLAVLYIASQPEKLRSDAAFSAMLFPVYGILPLALASLGLALYLAGKENRMLLRWLLFLLVYAIYIAFGFNLVGSAFLGQWFVWDIFKQLLFDFFNHVENIFYWFILFLGGFALFAASFMSARFACLSEDAVREPQPENTAQVKKGLVAWAILLAVCAACATLALNFMVIG